MRAETLEIRKNTILEPSTPLNYQILRIFGSNTSIRLEEDEEGYTELGWNGDTIQMRTYFHNQLVKLDEVSPEEAYILKLMAENGDQYDRRPSEIKCPRCDRNIPYDHRFFANERGLGKASVFEWHFKCPHCGHCEVVWNGY